MIGEILCGMLASVTFVVLAIVFSKIDKECLGHVSVKRLSLLCVCAFISGFCICLNCGRNSGIAIFPAVGYFMFCAYSDMIQHKTYTLLNILFFVAYGIVFIVTDFSLVTCIFAAFFCVLGFAGAFGMADGIFISIAVFIYSLYKDVWPVTFVLFLLVASVVFIIYSLILYIREKKFNSSIKFFKQKYPFIPALAAGALIGLMI